MFSGLFGLLFGSVKNISHKDQNITPRREKKSSKQLSRIRRNSKIAVDLSSGSTQRRYHDFNETLSLNDQNEKNRRTYKREIVPDEASYVVPFGLSPSDKSETVSTDDQEERLMCLMHDIRQELREETTTAVKQLGDEIRMNLSEMRRDIKSIKRINRKY